MRLVLGQGVMLAVVGTVIGLAVAYFATRLGGKFFFGVKAGDPLAFLIGCRRADCGGFAGRVCADKTGDARGSADSAEAGVIQQLQMAIGQTKTSPQMNVDTDLHGSES